MHKLIQLFLLLLILLTACGPAPAATSTPVITNTAPPTRAGGTDGYSSP